MQPYALLRAFQQQLSKWPMRNGGTQKPLEALPVRHPGKPLCLSLVMSISKGNVRFPSTCEKAGCVGIVAHNGSKTGNKKQGENWGPEAKKTQSVERGGKKKPHPSCPDEKAFN